MARTPSVVQPTVLTAQGAAKSAPCKVYWITVSNGHATENPLVQLNDSTDDSGTDRWATYANEMGTTTGNNTVHANFDPPILMELGCFVDISAATTIVVTVGLA